MATMQASPKRSVCPEKLRLTDAFQVACRELVDLHNAEINALITGEHLERSELALTRARQRREQAKEAILRHISMHGCDRG